MEKATPPAPPPPVAQVPEALQAPVVQPPAEAWARLVKGFHRRIALLCVAGSVLGSILGLFDYEYRLGFFYGYRWSVFLESAIWGGVWSAVMWPSLKPRRAWRLLAVGTIGLGIVHLLLFELDIGYRVIWPILGSIWGLAIAVAFQLPTKRRIALALIGAFSLGVNLPLLRALARFWDPRKIGLIHGLLPGLLLGGALGLFYGQQKV